MARTTKVTLSVDNNAFKQMMDVVKGCCDKSSDTTRYIQLTVTREGICAISTNGYRAARCNFADDALNIGGFPVEAEEEVVFYIEPVKVKRSKDEKRVYLSLVEEDDSMCAEVRVSNEDGYSYTTYGFYQPLDAEQMFERIKSVFENAHNKNNNTTYVSGSSFALAAAGIASFNDEMVIKMGSEYKAPILLTTTDEDGAYVADQVVIPLDPSDLRNS